MTTRRKADREHERRMNASRAATVRRVRKARWPGLCCQCSGPIVIGQQVAEIEPGQWAHCSCAIKLAGAAPTGVGS